MVVNRKLRIQTNITIKCSPNQLAPTPQNVNTPKSELNLNILEAEITKKKILQ